MLPVEAVGDGCLVDQPSAVSEHDEQVYQEGKWEATKQGILVDRAKHELALDRDLRHHVRANGLEQVLGFSTLLLLGGLLPALP